MRRRIRRGEVVEGRKEGKERKGGVVEEEGLGEGEVVEEEARQEEKEKKG